MYAYSLLVLYKERIALKLWSIIKFSPYQIITIKP